MDRETKKVLVFRVGSLGDTLVSLPALWAVREYFASAKITLLCDRQVGKQYVQAGDVLAGSGLADEFESYPVGGTRAKRMLGLLGLLVRLRRRRFDALVYLAPTSRSAAQVQRDCRFFRFAGIKRIIGVTNFPAYPRKTAGVPLPELPREADLLLSRLQPDGIPIPAPGMGRMDLRLTDADEREVLRWLETCPSDGGKKWVGVGPGSKMPAKVWPAGRFETVVLRLIQEFDIWPVVFGGPEDRAVGERLVSAWGRGYNAAGQLGLRASVAALGRCKIYLGNDTGTMHMATAAGVTCAAIFSSREPPGIWYPYGSGHRVFRTAIECEGCFLTECIARKMECVLSIEAQAVSDACAQMLHASTM